MIQEQDHDQNTAVPQDVPDHVNDGCGNLSAGLFRRERRDLFFGGVLQDQRQEEIEAEKIKVPSIVKVFEPLEIPQP